VQLLKDEESHVDWLEAQLHQIHFLNIPFTLLTMRLGRIVEGGQFEIAWSSEKPILPDPYPSSRSAAA
jgi:hypothetical protein